MRTRAQSKRRDVRPATSSEPSGDHARQDDGELTRASSPPQSSEAPAGANIDGLEGRAVPSLPPITTAAETDERSQAERVYPGIMKKMMIVENAIRRIERDDISVTDAERALEVARFALDAAAQDRQRAFPDEQAAVDEAISFRMGQFTITCQMMDERGRIAQARASDSAGTAVAHDQTAQRGAGNSDTLDDNTVVSTGIQRPTRADTPSGVPPRIFDHRASIMVPDNVANRDEIVDMIRRHGGKLTARPAFASVVVVDEHVMTETSPNLVGAHRKGHLPPLVRKEWVSDCVNQQALIDFHTNDYLVELQLTSLARPANPTTKTNSLGTAVRVDFTNADKVIIIEHLATTRASWTGFAVARELHARNPRHSAQSYQTFIRDNLDARYNLRPRVEMTRNSISSERLTELRMERQQQPRTTNAGRNGRSEHIALVTPVPQGENVNIGIHSPAQQAEHRTEPPEAPAVPEEEEAEEEAQVEEATQTQEEQNQQEQPLPQGDAAQHEARPEEVQAHQEVQAEGEGVQQGEEIQDAIPARHAEELQGGASVIPGTRAQQEVLPLEEAPYQREPSRRQEVLPLQEAEAEREKDVAEGTANHTADQTPQLTEIPVETSTAVPDVERDNATDARAAIANAKNGALLQQTEARTTSTEAFREDAEEAQASSSNEQPPDGDSSGAALTAEDSAKMARKLADWLVSGFSTSAPAASQLPTFDDEVEIPRSIFRELGNEEISAEQWQHHYEANRNSYQRLAEQLMLAYPSQYLSQPATMEPRGPEHGRTSTAEQSPPRWLESSPVTAKLFLGDASSDSEEGAERADAIAHLTVREASSASAPQVSSREVTQNSVVKEEDELDSSSDVPLASLSNTRLLSRAEGALNHAPAEILDEQHPQTEERDLETYEHVDLDSASPPQITSRPALHGVRRSLRPFQHRQAVPVAARDPSSSHGVRAQEDANDVEERFGSSAEQISSPSNTGHQHSSPITSPAEQRRRPITALGLSSGNESGAVRRYVQPARHSHSPSRSPASSTSSSDLPLRPNRRTRLAARRSQLLPSVEVVIDRPRPRASASHGQAPNGRKRARLASTEERSVEESTIERGAEREIEGQRSPVRSPSPSVQPSPNVSRLPSVTKPISKPNPRTFFSDLLKARKEKAMAAANTSARANGHVPPVRSFSHEESPALPSPALARSPRQNNAREQASTPGATSSAVGRTPSKAAAAPSAAGPCPPSSPQDGYTALALDLAVQFNTTVPTARRYLAAANGDADVAARFLGLL